MGGSMRGSLASAFVLVCTLQWCVGQQLSFPLDVAPSSVAVGRDNGEVFIAAGSQLLRLSNSLRLLETVNVTGELVRIALSPDGSRLVGCLGGDVRQCLVYDTSNLTSGASATVDNAHYNPQKGLAVIATADAFYLGSEGDIVGQEREQDNIFLAQYSYTSGEVVRTTGTSRFRVVRDNFVRYSYGGFSRNDYVYYFVADQGPSIAIRVLRVCDCGRQPCTTDEFQALYELILECRRVATENSRVCGVDVVESFGDRSGPLVVVTQCEEGGNRNRVCAFSLSDIDNDMDRYYNVCRDGDSSFELPWDISRSCLPVNSQSSPCDFGGTVPGINVEETTAEIPQRLGFYLVNPGAAFISASLAIVVEDVSLLYVAHSGGIQVYELTRLPLSSVSGEPTGEPVATISDLPAVRDISWQEGSDDITVTTDDTVILYPLETCSTATTCEQCTGSFPLCGWCTVEDKCSRRSQCLNSSESRRWVSSPDQCIATSLSPRQFSLAAPSILNVTASPDLPSNLTYNCSFSGSGDIFPVVVSAIEVEAGSQYQCDIRDSITALDFVKQVTEFSLVSVEVGIPFATSEDTLTIYNCTAALSCVECVDTENVCGWCVYGGFCSGNSDPCPTLADVNGTYLMLGDSAESTDVCPVVNRASTPSGHYTQPVGVARDLKLMTRNLPQPVDGFRYQCQLRDRNFEATLNEDNVTCIIPDGISSPSTEELVSLQLIWTNDTVTYSLNDNSTDDIMCILYNCGGLASGCSSCLGSNVAGYECGWCSDVCSVIEECSIPGSFSNSTSTCPQPSISSVDPDRGPREGGTRVAISGSDLGAVVSDIEQVRLRSEDGADVACSLAGEEGNYIPGLQIVCVTESVESAGEHFLEVEVRRDNSPSQNARIPFQVQRPVLTGVDPEFGPKSGGVDVVISGSALDTGNTDDTTVTLNGVNCVISEITESTIVCNSERFEVNATSEGPVVVSIDNDTASGVDFEFKNDPVFTSVSPRTVIPAGGIRLTFTGMNFDSVRRPVFVYTGSEVSSPAEGGPCTASSSTVMTCLLPNTTSPLTSNIGYTVRFGSAPGPDLTNEDLRLELRPNPRFADDGSALADSEFRTGEGGLLIITGTNLDNVERGEISVTVGGEKCEDRPSSNDDDSTTYVCDVPANPPNGNQAVVVITVGTNLRYNVGTVTYTESGSSTDTKLAIIIGGSAAGGIVLVSLLVIFCIICCFSRRARAKERRFANLLAQMELWEVEMADECKRAFTELQTDLADLVQISDDKILPYRDFRSFAMRFLFPSAGTDHPVLNPLAVGDSTEVIPHLENFKKLILNKKFLLLFVRTLEAQQGRFSLQDKCNVASLLMVAFQNDLDYATEILQTLLSEVMRQAVAKSHPKLLLRRTESVAEKMLANWLSFLLFPYLLEHAGESLFILYRAIKSQLEKGPVDVITGEARHSLSEEKLLRQTIDPKPVDGVVETDSGELLPVKLLDCDTVSQAKEKILDVLYKNTAVSRRPQLQEVDLELRRSNAGIPLRDYDQTNLKEGDWTKINTLGHYRLAEMSQAAIDNPKHPTPRFKLVPRLERPVSGINFDHVGTIIANLNASTMQSGPQVFHLTKPDQGETEDGTGPRQGKILSEVFLTRLLSTKRILQSYVDALFKAIFAVPRGKPLPKAIKCLFDFLDLQAAELGIQDPEILHTWKTNSLPLRFWVNLIKNPDFVFDINKSATVDACLTIIAQAYIDACSTSEIKYTKNTPSAKLLYVNEVRAYKQDVQQYYAAVQALPKLSPHDMSEYLRETAQVCSQSVDSSELDSKAVFMTRQLYFVTESALYELLKYAANYSEELQDALNEEGLSVMATQLEQLQAAIKV